MSDPLTNALRNLVTDPYIGGFLYSRTANVAYVVHDRSEPHCNEATRYNDVRGNVRWRCRHGGKEQ